jgi:hypothetical protein
VPVIVIIMILAKMPLLIALNIVSAVSPFVEVTMTSTFLSDAKLRSQIKCLVDSKAEKT